MAKLAKCLILLAALAWAGGVPAFGLMSTTAQAWAAGGGEKGHDVVEVNIGMLIWQIILFVVFFSVLAKFVWPPILKGLKGREEKMRSDLASAENAAKEATATLDQYKQQLAEAQQEARRVVDEARQTASKVEANLIAEAEAKAAEVRQRNVAEIEAAKEQALSEIYAQTAELSTQIASKILKREISAQDQAQLVSDSLAELTSRN